MSSSLPPIEVPEPTHIEVEADVRYWEDATVNGEEDSRGDLIPGRDGNVWRARIRLADGVVVGWPARTSASIHYKVCDAGLYWLTDEAGRRVAKWAGDYVPSDFLCHGDNGYGDYIIMAIGEDGAIAHYERPDVRADEWQPLVPTAQPPSQG